jgi:hypothetical protein
MIPGELPASGSSKTRSKYFHHRGTEGTEFYFVNCAYVAQLTIKSFLCALCASVVKIF